MISFPEKDRLSDAHRLGEERFGNTETKEMGR